MGNISLLLATGATTLLLAFNGTGHYSTEMEENNQNKSFVNTHSNHTKNGKTLLDSDSCVLKEVQYIEDNEEIVLDFDTSEYLPIGFNAYEGMTFDISEIDYVEIEDEIVLGFDTKDYLPTGFNPYAEYKLYLDEIIYIEEEEEFELGFDPSMYLPQGFNALSI